MIKHTIQYQLSDLLYDIETRTESSAEMREAAGGNFQQVALTRVSQDEVILHQVKQSLALAHAECVEALYPYTKETVDAPQEITKNYIFHLTLPDGFSQTTINLLQQLLREYLICRAISDWFAIVFPETQQSWEVRVMYIRERIRTCLMSRRHHLHRKLRPF